MHTALSICRSATHTLELSIRTAIIAQTTSHSFSMMPCNAPIAKQTCCLLLPPCPSRYI